MLVTADHGNAEMMEDPVTHEPHTAHTLNRVPVVLVNGPGEGIRLRDGRLADIAPTHPGAHGPAAAEGNERPVVDGAGSRQDGRNGSRAACHALSGRRPCSPL